VRRGLPAGENMSWKQLLVAVAAGVAFGFVIISIARRGILSMRYTVGWLFIASCIVVSGLLGGLVTRIAKAMGIQPAVLVTAVAGVTMLSITVQLSITVSGLTERVRTLAERCAILEERNGPHRLRASGETGSADVTSNEQAMNT